MSKGANLWAVRVVPRAPGAKVEVGRVGEVEPEDDLQVREGIQSHGRLGVEPVAVDPEDGASTTPVIVSGLDAPTDHVGNGFDPKRLACHSSSFVIESHLLRNGRPANGDYH